MAGKNIQGFYKRLSLYNLFCRNDGHIKIY